MRKRRARGGSVALPLRPTAAAALASTTAAAATVPSQRFAGGGRRAALVLVPIAAAVVKADNVFAALHAAAAYGESLLERGRIGDWYAVAWLTVCVYVSLILFGALAFACFNFTLFGSVFPSGDEVMEAGDDPDAFREIDEK